MPGSCGRPVGERTASEMMTQHDGAPDSVRAPSLISADVRPLPSAPAVEHCSGGAAILLSARALSALLTLVLLFVLHRKYELPYVALFFFSLPLVVQQFVVVSADTLLNIGALAAVALFLELRQRRSWILMAALWTIAIAITASKFIVAGVLLLPLMLVPYRRIPKPALAAAAAILFLVPASYVLGTLVLGAVREVGRSLNALPEVERQLELARRRQIPRVSGRLAGRGRRSASADGRSARLAGYASQPAASSLIRASAWVALF